MSTDPKNLHKHEQNDTDDEGTEEETSPLEELNDRLEDLSDVVDAIKNQSARLHKVRPEVAGREIGETIMPLLDELGSTVHDMFAALVDFFNQNIEIVPPEETEPTAVSAPPDMDNVFVNLATVASVVNQSDNFSASAVSSEGVPSDGAP